MRLDIGPKVATAAAYQSVAVAGGLRFRQVSAGYEHTCGVNLAGAGILLGMQ